MDARKKTRESDPRAPYFEVLGENGITSPQTFLLLPVVLVRNAKQTVVYGLRYSNSLDMINHPSVCAFMWQDVVVFSL